MATRFRLTADATAPDVSPAFQSYSHSQGTRRKLVTSDASALATQAYTPDAADHLAAGDAAHIQFVSDPLGVQTFTVGDAFKFAVQGLEAHASNNLAVQVFIGLVSNDGTTALATLRSKASEGTELATSLANRFLSSTLSGGYTTTGGERLVIEFSVTGTPAAAGGTQGHNASLRWGGDGAGGDLPENDTETGTTFNPWLEFANTIVFPDPPTTIGTVWEDDTWEDDTWAADTWADAEAGGPTPTTATLTANNKTYDATTAATGTLTLSGIDPGHDVSVSAASMTFATANAGAGIVVTASGLTLSGADAALYELTSTTATDGADITARAITITADNKQKYEGEPDPALTASVTSGAIQGSDTASGSLTRVAGEAVGTYAINQGTYTYGSNYSETFVAGTLTIDETPVVGARSDRRRRSASIRFRGRRKS